MRKPYEVPDDEKYLLGLQCSIEAVKADKAWEYWDIENGEMPGDENILLASVDTGVDYTHPDLIENIWVNQGEIPDIIFEIGVDTNDDGNVDVMDIIGIVNNILGTVDLDEVGLCAGDLNADENIDVMDIIAVVNIILGNRSADDDATSVKFIRTTDGLSMESNGYVGAFEMTLNHNEEFSLNLVSKTVLEGVSAYHTDGNMTRLVVVTPIDGEIFETNNEFTISEVVSVNSQDYINSEIVQSYVLATNYPNPFNPSTTISYELVGDSHVNIAIYNIMGQEVLTLVNDFRSTGSYSVVWNGTNSNGTEMPSGVYFMKLDTKSHSISNKLSLLR